MSDALKSSLDIAMERMNKIVGDEDLSLSDDQKRRIAEVRKEYEAKAAEKKILLAGNEELTAALQSVSQEKEEKIKAIYAEEK
jgi:hypothetical protein